MEYHSGKYYSRYSLQWIALLTMLLDHVGCLLVSRQQYPELYALLRMTGRLAFPLFCFMLTEGLQYTRSIGRYLLRIGIFALLSELPFDLAFCNGWSWEKQNVLFTLFLGLLLLWGMETVNALPRAGIQLFCSLLLVGGTGLLAEGLHTDYGFWGILLILAFYIGKRQAAQAGNRNRMAWLPGLVLVGMGISQWPALFSLYFIQNYRGEDQKKMPGWLLYVFYPLHLLMLYGMGCLL